MDTLTQPARDISLEYPVEGMNFQAAGEASSNIKHTLQLVGYHPEVIRRVAIAAYEMEMNIVIHAFKGTLQVKINPERIEISANDQGPGIANIHLAMQEGFSTASEKIREMGFGAGMGLPNIGRCSDELILETKVGEGTMLKIIILNRERK